MYEKRLLREREDMSDEVKEGLTDTSDEVKQKQEIEEEHDEERGEEHDGASRNKTAARQRTKLATTHQLLWQRKTDSHFIRTPSAPTPTSSVDGCNGCAAMT